MAPPRELQRAGHALHGDLGRGNARELGIEEADVEGRVVDDECVARDEAQEVRGHIGKQRLVFEEVRRQPVHGDRFHRHVALRIDEAVELAPRGDAVQELDAADLDQAVAAVGIEAGGLGVEHDLAHGIVIPESAGRIKPSSADTPSRGARAARR